MVMREGMQDVQRMTKRSQYMETFYDAIILIMCIYPTTLWIESEAGGLILQNRYHLNSAGVEFAEDMPAAGLKTQGEYNLKVNINY